MNRVPARVRPLVRVVALGALASVVLASCATAPKAPTPHVTGLPAISISVPLSAIACTTDNSCVTLGTSNLNVSPTSVGEYRPANGHWTALTVPSADASTYIATSSCWSNGCLFVGSQSSGDLVWRYADLSHAITVAAAPTGATGITAVSCYGPSTCAILDSTKDGPRFLTTTDGGATWSTPVTLEVAPHESVSSLSCVSTIQCMASLQDSPNGVAVLVTDDGGATWTARTGPSTVTWSVLTSLNCSGHKCLGLAKLFTGWRLFRTDNFGKKWTKVARLHGSNLTLACTSLQRCVVGGMTNFQSSLPLLTTVISGAVTTVKLTYVPSPISNVACGSKICAAIGVTTVMTLRP
jgi:photosystem II stability/assembly factor-like uncharacterized protein